MDNLMLTPEERRVIPKGFHYLLEYKEELDWLLQTQLAKAEPLIRKDERERIIGVIENLNSIGYAYGAEFKVAILQALKKEGK